MPESPESPESPERPEITDATLARAVIRLATVDDAERCRAIYAPAVTDLATSFETEVPAVEEMARRIAATLERTPWLVWDDPVSGVLGYAYAGRHRERAAYGWTAETTVYLDPAAAGRGIGRALYTALLAVLELQGFRLAVAGTTLPNDASVGLHRALGFRDVGVFHGIGRKFGAARDVAWFERPIGDDTGTGDAAPIRPLAEVLDDPEFAAALARPFAG